MTSLWAEFWDRYCEVTHFHGFHEMHMVKNTWNRVYWTISIISGFALAIVLMIYGTLNNLEDPVTTLVTTQRNGALDMPVLYCPARWVDFRKLAKLNGTDKELTYALSYLKVNAIMPVSFDIIFDNFGGENWNTDEADLALDLETDAQIDFRFLLSSLYWYRDPSLPPISANYTPFATSILMLIYTLPYGSYSFNIPTFEEYAKRHSGLMDFYHLILKLYLIGANEQLDDVVYRYFPIGYSDNTTAMGFEHFEILLLNMYHNSIANNLIKGYLGQQIKSFPESEIGLGQQPAVFEDYAYDCITLESLDQLNDALSAQIPNAEGTSRKFRGWTKCTDIFRSVKELTKDINKWRPGRRFWIERLLTLLFPVIPQNFIGSFVSRNKFIRERATAVLKNIFLDEQVKAYYGDRGFTGLVDLRRSLSDYLMQTGATKSELSRLVNNPDRKFFMDEEKHFNEFLSKHSFENALDFLKNVSVDPNQFIVSISQYANRILAPKTANITAAKVMTELGICLQLKITVPPTADQLIQLLETYWAVYDPLLDGFSRLDGMFNENKVSKTYHISIVPVIEDSYATYDAINPYSVIAFGDDVYNHFPGERWYSPALHQARFANLGISVPSIGQSQSFVISNTDTRKTWLGDYATFNISSIEIQQRQSRPGFPCKYDSQTEHGERYTFANCLSACDDVRQPKVFNSYAWVAKEPYAKRIVVKCRFGKRITEIPQINDNTLKECSFFTFMTAIHNSKDETYMSLAQEFIQNLNASINGEMARELSQCLKSCLEPCNSLTMSVQQGFREGYLKEYYQPIFEGRSNDGIFEFNTTVPSENSLKIVQAYFEIGNYLVKNNLSAGMRIHLEINSDSITYTEKRTFTWDSMIGIVGGQIGLVTGASLLTFVQLFWVIIRTIHQVIRRKRMRSFQTPRLADYSANTEHIAVSVTNLPTVIKME